MAPYGALARTRVGSVSKVAVRLVRAILRGRFFGVASSAPKEVSSVRRLVLRAPNAKQRSALLVVFATVACAALFHWKAAAVVTCLWLLLVGWVGMESANESKEEGKN